jgi:hypothetical protein
MHSAQEITPVNWGRANPEPTMESKARILDDTALFEELRKLEQETSMTAWDWYHRFQECEMGDSADVMRWAGICYMALRRGVLTPSSAH